MTLFSKEITRTKLSPKYTRGRFAKIDRIVLHHMASTNGVNVINNVFGITGGRQVSSNYATGGNHLWGVVSERNTPWTNGNFYWNTRSVTFEIENESTRGWTVSRADHERVARACADICKRHSIVPTANTIVPHRDLYAKYGVGYATACPGGLDVAWIIRRTAELLNTKVKPVKPKKKNQYNLNLTLKPVGYNISKSTAAAAQAQGLLRAHGYKIDVDGYWGRASQRVAESFQRGHQLTVYKYGNIDRVTWNRLVTPELVVRNIAHYSGPAAQAQGLLVAHGYNLAVDGYWGTSSEQAITRFQKGHNLKVKKYGQVCDVTWRRLLAH